MSKKKLFAMMALVIVLAILGTGTLAYFTTKAMVHNVITSGGVGITLLEDFPNADEDNVLDGVMPGSTHRKAVKVRNDQEEAWIRVKVEVKVNKNLDPEMLSIVYNTGDEDNQWTEHEGWFYYNSPVGKGQVTSDLFQNVSFNGEDMGNEYQNSEFTIDVFAQAVQTANNPPQVEGKVTTVEGWPKN